MSDILTIDIGIGLKWGVVWNRLKMNQDKSILKK